MDTEQQWFPINSTANLANQMGQPTLQRHPAQQPPPKPPATPTTTTESGPWTPSNSGSPSTAPPTISSEGPGANSSVTGSSSQTASQSTRPPKPPATPTTTTESGPWTPSNSGSPSTVPPTWPTKWSGTSGTVTGSSSQTASESTGPTNSTETPSTTTESGPWTPSSSGSSSTASPSRPTKWPGTGGTTISSSSQSAAGSAQPSASTSSVVSTTVIGSWTPVDNGPSSPAASIGLTDWPGAGEIVTQSPSHPAGGYTPSSISSNAASTGEVVRTTVIGSWTPIDNGQSSVAPPGSDTESSVTDENGGPSTTDTSRWPLASSTDSTANSSRPRRDTSSEPSNGWTQSSVTIGRWSDAPGSNTESSSSTSNVNWSSGTTAHDVDNTTLNSTEGITTVPPSKMENIIISGNIEIIIDNNGNRSSGNRGSISESGAFNLTGLHVNGSSVLIDGELVRTNGSSSKEVVGVENIHVSGNIGINVEGHNLTGVYNSTDQLASSNSTSDGENIVNISGDNVNNMEAVTTENSGTSSRDSLPTLESKVNDSQLISDSHNVVIDTNTQAVTAGKSLSTNDAANNISNSAAVNTIVSGASASREANGNSNSGSSLKTVVSTA
nr:PREDICTED: cell wall protein IFF6-like [Megachile rotundata]